jgi:hypothetical protein
MSILMLIKYPISNPPTDGQLAALPPELYNEWLTSLGLDSVSTLFQPGFMYRTLNSLHKTGNDDAYEKLLHLIYMLDE